MALPLIAAGIAARAAVSKLATRAAGGITGSGAKSIGSVYKEQGFSNSVLSRPSYTPTNSFGSNSVKVTSGVTKQEQNMVNNMRTELLNDKKSGVTAKNSAAMRERVHLGIPKKPTVKINSGNTRAR